ncbi:Noc2-domain-containing protein [Guyanagaster necrorhizus]|uniref:Noc2-domain-containing protein n=1 Tax=Guyanagaster necrorhizus TaxID=856835 RepID=A0A9P7VVJ1_9AGAR|nr:Noc2-domain-containing protein [Guyanagaster necrorhizus MCA 3950]KAG7447240.1 Noc2-domain-containing protein [Guyanagaster necrorhizus MCA 3950]
MGKASKSMKKFASSGQLKKTIEARRKHQQVRKKVQGKKSGRAKSKVVDDVDDDMDDDEEVEEKPTRKGMTVDDILGAGFMEGSDADGDQSEGTDDSDNEEDAASDNDSFADVDGLEDDEGRNHLTELAKLAETDPEFYKYLQDNDKELLDFNPSADAADHGDQDEDSEGDAVMDEAVARPILSSDIIRGWQKALLEHRSLRALRKLLVAFKSAVHMNEEDQMLAWSIDNSSVYNKLITTALRFTPVVLEHHVPYKKLPNGKFKPPTQTQKFKTLQKLILSCFHNIIHLLSQLTDNEMIELAVTESAKIVPYVVSSRKTIKLYLKKCLELWSSAGDSIRIASFLAIRRLASATDESILDNVLKGTYLTLVRSSKSTTVHTIPAINLMKNSASEIFCLDHAASYQLAFGYIRQLAIHLRNSMKLKSKESYKQVYNWQYVHSIDFWSLVLARACDVDPGSQEDGDSELKPLIYPLVQVSLGAIKLISSNRSYPFHLHVIRSLLHLTRHTQIYIPISPYLLPILASTLSSPSKPSTLRPLDFEVQIRCPQQYQKTRVYVEGLIEESSFLLAEWLSTAAVQGSIAFPEIAIPILVTLRRSLKAARVGSGSGKDLGVVKTLIERMEESARWVESRRKNLKIAPGRQGDVDAWQEETKGKAGDSPLARYVKVQRKVREKRRELVEKAREGKAEILSD